MGIFMPTKTLLVQLPSAITNEHKNTPDKNVSVGGIYFCFDYFKFFFENARMPRSVPHTVTAMGAIRM